MRYIDADACIDEMRLVMLGSGFQTRATNVIKYAPTADVVPKSEVEKLNQELDELAEEHSNLIVEKDRLFDEVERLQALLECGGVFANSIEDWQTFLNEKRAEVANEIIGIIDKRMELKIEQCKGIHNEIVLSVYRGQHDAYRDIKEIIEQKYGGQHE